MIDKLELVNAASRMTPESSCTTTGTAEGTMEGAAATCSHATASNALRRLHELKALGDEAFGARAFHPAERHYTNALREADTLERHYTNALRQADTLEGLTEGGGNTRHEGAPENLRAVLYSNRSACRAHQKRYEEALQDGHDALRWRPTWVRAISRVGLVLYHLGRFEEAKRTYEEGLRGSPGAAELQAGLARVLREVDGHAAGSRGVASAAAASAAASAAACAKGAGNAAFAAGDDARAIRSYGEALSLSPSDPILYSNRSALLARLGRWKEASLKLILFILPISRACLLIHYRRHTHAPTPPHFKRRRSTTRSVR